MWKNKNRIFGSKKGFNLIEFLIVVAITAIMAGIVISSFMREKAKKEVEIEAQRLAAILKEAQTYALTGRTLGSSPTLIPCNFYFKVTGIYPAAQKYEITYDYRDVTSVSSTCASPSGPSSYISYDLITGRNGLKAAMPGPVAQSIKISVPWGQVTANGRSPITVSNRRGESYEVSINSVGRISVNCSGAGC